MDASQPPPEPQPTLAVEEAQPAQALPTKTEEQHSASSSPSASKTALPSLALFKKHLRCDANGVVDGTRAIGKECFLEWEASRAASDGDDNPHKSAKAFQRNLTAHLTGSDGRSPFLPDEEASILLALRAKRVWPAFADIKGCTIGARGFRGFGYHEKSTSGLPVVGRRHWLPSDDAVRPSTKRAHAADDVMAAHGFAAAAAAAAAAGGQGQMGFGPGYPAWSPYASWAFLLPTMQPGGQATNMNTLDPRLFAPRMPPFQVPGYPVMPNLPAFAAAAPVAEKE